MATRNTNILTLAGAEYLRNALAVEKARKDAQEFIAAVLESVLQKLDTMPLLGRWSWTASKRNSSGHVTCKCVDSGGATPVNSSKLEVYVENDWGSGSKPPHYMTVHSYFGHMDLAKEAFQKHLDLGAYRETLVSESRKRPGLIWPDVPESKQSGVFYESVLLNPEHTVQECSGVLCQLMLSSIDLTERLFVGALRRNT